MTLRANKIGYVLLVVSTFALCLVLSTRYAIDLYQAVVGNQVSPDFEAFFGAAIAYASRDNIYKYSFIHGLLAYVYPPTLAVVLSPFAAVSMNNVQSLWLILNQALLIVSIWMSVKVAQVRLSLWQWLILGCAVFGSYSLFTNMKLAQVSGVLFFFTAAALWFWSRGKPVWGAFMLAFAVSIKIYPIVFLVYFLWKRQYRFAIWTILFTAIIQLVPDILFGTNVINQYLSDGSRLAVDVNDPSVYASQSIHSLLIRLLVFLPPYNEPNAMGGISQIISYGVRFVVFVVSVWAVARQVNRETLRISILEANVLLIAIVAVLPFTWSHYYLWMLIAAPTLIVELTERIRSNPMWQNWTLVAISIIGMICLSQPFRIARFLGFDFETGTIDNLPEALSASILLYGALAIWGVTIFLLRSRRSEVIPSPVVSS